MSRSLANLYQECDTRANKPMTDDIQRGSRGPAPSWNLGRTRTIRVPIAIAEKLVEIARKMDYGEPIEANVLFAREELQELSKSRQPAACPG